MAAHPHKPDWLVQMQGILETLNEGVIIVDDCHQIIFINNYLYRLTGYPAGTMLGRTADQFYEGEDAAFIRKQITVGEQQGENRYEFYIPDQAGMRIPVIISARTIEDPDGRAFVVITFTDISEQKRAEEQLRQANRKLQERQEEIERDLQLAARVQQSLAPRSMTWGPFAVEAFYMPVSTIGGDFGLVTPLGNGQLNLLVCDVSGHGISSALVANRIYSELVSLLERHADLPEMLERLNQFVLQHIRMSSFYFSLAAARLRDHSGHVTFASAGHPPALLVRRSGEVQRLASRSTVLGVLTDAVDPNPTEEVELSRGDRVMLYTDGFTEAFNQQDEMLGVEGIEDVLRENVRLPLPELKQAVLDRVVSWRYGPATDDMSLVLVELQ